eukprot:6851621-Pyramimonas_sp.AAC.1
MLTSSYRPMRAAFQRFQPYMQNYTHEALLAAQAPAKQASQQSAQLSAYQQSQLSGRAGQQAGQPGAPMAAARQTFGGGNEADSEEDSRGHKGTEVITAPDFDRWGNE